MSDIKETSATVWIDKYSHTMITLHLEDLFKLMSGKKIEIEVKDGYDPKNK